jgi:hypothetical protein
MKLTLVVTLQLQASADQLEMLDVVPIFRSDSALAVGCTGRRQRMSFALAADAD